MRARSLKLLISLSFLATVASPIAWGRSLRHTDGVCYTAPTFYFRASSERGAARAAWGPEDGRSDACGVHLFSIPDGTHYPRGARALLAATSSFQIGIPHLDVRVPYQLVFLLGALIASWWALQGRREWREKHRELNGVCEGCGYDLRASAGRCPECGAGAGIDCVVTAVCGAGLAAGRPRA